MNSSGGGGSMVFLLRNGWMKRAGEEREEEKADRARELGLALLKFVMESSVFKPDAGRPNERKERTNDGRGELGILPPTSWSVRPPLSWYSFRSLCSSRLKEEEEEEADAKGAVESPLLAKTRQPIRSNSLALKFTINPERAQSASKSLLLASSNRSKTTKIEVSP